jgi:hypothetical protein
VERRSDAFWPSTGRDSVAGQAVGQSGQDDAADHCVGPIPLPGERSRCKCQASDRRGNGKRQSELNPMRRWCPSRHPVQTPDTLRSPAPRYGIPDRPARFLRGAAGTRRRRHPLRPSRHSDWNWNHRAALREVGSRPAGAPVIAAMKSPARFFHLAPSRIGRNGILSGIRRRLCGRPGDG